MSEPERILPERRIYPAERPGKKHKILKEKLEENSPYFLQGIGEVFYEQENYVGEIPMVTEPELHVEKDVIRPVYDEHEGQPQIETVLGETRGVFSINCPKGLCMNYIEDTEDYLPWNQL
jgi:hypothetical protein